MGDENEEGKSILIKRLICGEMGGFVIGGLLRISTQP